MLSHRELFRNELSDDFATSAAEAEELQHAMRASLEQAETQRQNSLNIAIREERELEETLRASLEEAASSRIFFDDASRGRGHSKPTPRLPSSGSPRLSESDVHPMVARIFALIEQEGLVRAPLEQLPASVLSTLVTVSNEQPMLAIQAVRSLYTRLKEGSCPSDFSVALQAHLCECLASSDRESAGATAISSSPLTGEASVCSAHSPASGRNVTLRCEFCGRESTDLRLCAGCSSAAYCNQECQRLGWSVHKRDCRRRRKRQALSAASQHIYCDGEANVLRAGAAVSAPNQPRSSSSVFEEKPAAPTNSAYLAAIDQVRTMG